MPDAYGVKNTSQILQKNWKGRHFTVSEQKTFKLSGKY